ncbi:MAG: polysaccharide biosynthesis/export family protein, partial [Verrucomicrobiota bacterium]
MKTFLRAWMKVGLALLVAITSLYAGDEARALPVGENPPPPPVFSGPNAMTKGVWQQRLTLGPGDVVNFSFYGRPELTRNDVAIEPDGRISYLQVQMVLTNGLTLDELRETMTSKLAQFYQRPRIIVTPGAFKSKKFCVLGKVVNKGAYILDRPMTVLEAVAQAGGLETGLFQLNTVELADLPRSFIIRQGR